MRDDFPEKIKEVLAKRVGMQCSNPHCRKLTSGPRMAATKFVNIGVAAHITAASARGPRYDALLSNEKRCSALNGIWLCQNCAKLIDNDEKRYTPKLLRQWKTSAEAAALEALKADSLRAPAKSRDAEKLIVAIDDDSECLQMIVARLRMDYKVSGFVSAGEGLAFLLSNLNRVSLVLLDMMMRMPPGVRHSASADGIFAGMWILEQAKKQIREYRVPVIIVSGALPAAIERRIKRFNKETYAGLVTFVSKPIAVEFLVSEVKHNLDLWNK